jgi:hypothetical protein
LLILHVSEGQAELIGSIIFISTPMWFRRLTGFDEDSPENVREHLHLDGNKIISRVNNQSFQYGSLEIPSLCQLKNQAPPREIFKDRISVKEIVADVQQLHCAAENRNALFQAASQFNLLEMVAPHITPEMGIGRYQFDRTQGPACAIACGAGTIYRNYFVPVNGRTGQSSDNQINCLEEIGQHLNNKDLNLWKMQNGYALLNEKGLLKINSIINGYSDSEREVLKSKLKIGIQWDTEVTLSESRHLVSQAYCSALPVAYTSIDSVYWEKFASIILEACYEATLFASMINLDKTDCNIVYLTLVGGGAFGNETDWIISSMKKALDKFRNIPLDIRIVSYGRSNPMVHKLLTD